MFNVASKVSEYDNIHLEVKYYWFYRTENFYITPCDGILDQSTGILFTPKFKTTECISEYIVLLRANIYTIGPLKYKNCSSVLLLWQN